MKLFLTIIAHDRNRHSDLSYILQEGSGVLEQGHASLLMHPTEHRRCANFVELVEWMREGYPGSELTGRLDFGPRSFPTADGYDEAAIERTRRTGY
jgi:hypothetical protein